MQGALIGAGASIFGIGSDIAGSIRVPAMFNGIFGHKPTGTVVSVTGHFPSSADECFNKYLVIGPMCRYAKDLPTLVHIMAGKNAYKLRLDEQLYTKDIKVNNKTRLTRQFIVSFLLICVDLLLRRFFTWKILDFHSLIFPLKTVLK